MGTPFLHRCRRVTFPAAAFLIAGFAFVVAPPASVAQTNLITNGNFETGTFAGWTRANVADPSDTSGQRNFLIDTPGTTTAPASDGFFFNTASNTLPGGGGSFYAVSVNDLSGESALLQSFTVPNFPGNATLRVIFSFDAFVNDQTGFSTITDSSGLDYTTGGLAQPRDNQHARVDLLTSSATAFSTSASDVLLNVPLNVPINDDPNTTPNPYQRYSVDISSKVVRGGTYKIRFAEVNNLSALNLGVDNVSIIADIMPEPSTLSLFAFAPALFLVRLRRQKNGRDAHA